MKHSRSIDLSNPESPFQYDTWKLDAVPEWYHLGAHCSACGHRNILDRWELERRLGKGIYLARVRERLRCTACGERSQIGLFVHLIER